MPVFELDDNLRFPPPSMATPSGLLAIGGDLMPARLLLAYRQGIFPWYEDGLPILWHSPDPRMVLETNALRTSRSLRKVLRKHAFEIRLDTAFRDVITACAETERPGQDGTWITGEMIEAYVALHEQGVAHSAEAWRDGALVGGLYGVSLGAAYFGESMFAWVPDASKVAFVTLVAQLRRWSLPLIDCQVYTDHLARFGATEWPRERFLTILAELLDHPTRRGPWRLDPDLAHGAEPN